jgi:hypothetical protein
MPNLPVAKRRSLRQASRRPASMVMNLYSKQTRVPCLVLESSNEGFRVRGSLNLRRGQTIELIFGQDAVERCNVVWVGKTGTKYEGEVGLETVSMASVTLQGF